jgi:hypothetical protein
MDVISIFKTVLSGYYETVGLKVVLEESSLITESTPLRRSTTLYTRKPEPEVKRMFTVDNVDMEFEIPVTVSRSGSGISNKVVRQSIETKALYTN